MSSRRDAGLQQPQLRVGLVAIGLGAPQRELDVAGVEPRNHVAGGDAVAFVDPQLERAAADFGGDADLGGLDVAGRARRSPSSRAAHAGAPAARTDGGAGPSVTRCHARSFLRSVSKRDALDVGDDLVGRQRRRRARAAAGARRAHRARCAKNIRSGPTMPSVDEERVRRA